MRKSSQQQNIQWSERAETYTFALNTQNLSESTLSSSEIVFKEKPRIPTEFDLEFTCDSTPNLY